MTSPTSQPDMTRALLELGLRGAAAHIDDLVARATQRRWSPAQLVEELVRVESADRTHRSLERRRKRSKIASFKPMADFDWAWPSKLKRDLLERVLRLRFMQEAANVIVVGPHGLGKTMILANIAHEAIMAGHTVYYVTAAKLIADLSVLDSARTLERRIRHYVSFALLCIDELGYLSYDSRAADLLFEVVSRRHAAGKPIALTTNLAFADWTQVFPNATSTVALVDRLTHRADIVVIEGKSWRHKEAKERIDRRDDDP